MATKKRKPAASTILKELKPNEAIAVNAIANGEPVNASLVSAGVRARDANSGLSAKLRNAVTLLHAERAERWEIESDDVARRLTGIIYSDTESTRDQIQAARLLGDMAGWTSKQSTHLVLKLDAARAATVDMDSATIIEMLRGAERNERDTEPPE